MQQDKRAQPRRLLLLSTAGSIGGMERMVCGLSREFTQRGWSVRTVFPMVPNSNALLKWCSEQGVNAECSSALLDAAAPHTFTDLLKLRNLIQQANPDVVHLHYGDNFISLKDVIAARLAGTHHCVVTSYHPTQWNVSGSRKRVLTRMAALLAHRVTTCSHATQDVLIEAGIPDAKIQLIPCGLRPPQRIFNRDEARARFGFSPKAFVVGCLARLVAHKGIDDLIHAMASLPDPHQEVVLAIGGDGPERPNLVMLADSYPERTTTFIGRVPDVDEFLSACDVFALPSHLEGFGLVYVEAAFHGLPSVGTNVGGIPDAIIHGETGFLIPVGDQHALAAAVQTLWQDPSLRHTIGQAARSRALTELTEVTMADRYEITYHS